MMQLAYKLEADNYHSNPYTEFLVKLKAHLYPKSVKLSKKKRFTACYKEKYNRTFFQLVVDEQNTLFFMLRQQRRQGIQNGISTVFAPMCSVQYTFVHLIHKETKCVIWSGPRY